MKPNLNAFLESSQEHVTGTVKLELYEGNVICVGRSSELLPLR